MEDSPPQTRIQKKNTRVILDAALEVFAAHGFRGATLDQIAAAAGLSKPNLLYYYPSKEAMHAALLSALLDTWLDPLRKLNADGDPVEEIVAYVGLKLQMARDFPRESRLFANEIIQGAPRLRAEIEGPLRRLVDEKARIIRDWSDAGRIAALDPHHLIFSIWATTQHYADFDVQVRGIVGNDTGHLETAQAFLEAFYRKALSPD